MADIKNYQKEREKREKNQITYQQKINRHKRAAVYRVLLVLLVLAVVAGVVVYQYKRHIYTGYDTISTVTRETSSDSSDMRLQNAILTYSKDGVHCTDVKGDVKWNQTYQIQDMKIVTCQDTVAIGSYNGREIYIQNVDKQLGTVTTTMPIRNLAVATNGFVTAILEDTDVTWINTYSPDGKTVYTGQAYMHDGGYPAAISLSPSGELLAVSYVYVDAGVIKTNVAFYNLGPVGANHSDHIVSVYTYQDTLVPQIQFMDNDTAFAVGDGRLMIYAGAQKPMSTAECFYTEEVQSVFFNENYIGLVYVSEKAEARYRMDVYNPDKGENPKLGSYYFNVDYTDIFFEEEQFVAYNETECQIITFSNVEKYCGFFSKPVNLMLPTSKAYKYVLVTDSAIDTIQLK